MNQTPMDRPPLPLGQCNILIIDDRPENLQLLSQTLSEHGYTIRGAVKGKMGIKAALSSPPDLILLDIKMPDIDGYEVCKILKSEPTTQETPIIFLSALDEAIDKVQAFQVGGADYITKPFQVEEVLARVEHQLLIRQLNKQLLEKSEQLQVQNQQLQQEIIERRKAEKAAEAASKAKSEFVANMSHELRTPLNAILGFTQILNRGAFLTREQREYLEIINHSGEHLLGLVDDVLELSKIEAGTLTRNETSFDFYYFLDSLEEMFQIKAEQKKLHLRIQVGAEVPQYIKTDQQKLRCCLINLIGNSLKFTHQGNINLRVSLVTDRNPSTSQLHVLCFEVEDTGIGIPVEEIDTIFQAFAQTETGRKSTEGAGLGLAITQKFVELMGGEISVRSTVGVGTTFQFQVLFSPLEATEIISAQRQRVIGLQPHQKDYRILVVDDTKENRLLLLKLLEPIGFLVDEAENGQQALERWSSFKPDLIWMDTRMPVMNGLEATREIRNREKGLECPRDLSDSLSTVPRRHTIIIALTASTFEEKRQEILAAGFDDFVRKPFAEEVIFDKMAEYLEVRYIYENLPQSASAPRRLRTAKEQPDSFFLEAMDNMPLDWVKALKRASQNLNEELVDRLIEQIPASESQLTEELQELLNDFRLDIILNLTQSYLESKSL